MQKLTQLLLVAFVCMLSSALSAQNAPIELSQEVNTTYYTDGSSKSNARLLFTVEGQMHRLQEIWQPIGVVGCITAFNFPMAVFAWNFCLAAVCGNSMIWKPSPHSNQCAFAIKGVWDKVAG